MQNPPDNIDPALYSWLLQEVGRLDRISDSARVLPLSTSIPSKPVEGALYYFPAAVSPDITQAGFWGYSASGWILLSQITNNTWETI